MRGTKMKSCWGALLGGCFLFGGAPLAAQSLLGTPPAPVVAPSGPDLSKQPTLYVIGYAHLDTQWRWEYPQTISEFLPKTLHTNFDLFAKYPDYIFNFSGANRYRMMKEYYPADYEKLKQYVASGRWFLAGSSMEESDVNSPSAESIIRQILYGNHFFRHDFGKASEEYMLPDCFGFPWSLPSILAYSGIKGFSTQKLTWGSSAPAGGPGSIENTPEGTPFNVGLWEGPDGKSVMAALNPGSYSGGVAEDLSNSPKWIARVQNDGKVSGVYADYHYYGTGDTGGSPRDSSVAWVQKSVNSDGPLHVISATADQMFRDITPDEMKNLPRYDGELLLTNHSAGSITSETYQKRWNRENELLADAAERASVGAAWLGGRTYPLQRLNDAWALVMGGQFHDIMAGTATPRAYTFSWNDDVLAMNQFAGVLTSATEAVASAMNTQAQGTALVVYNPLSIQRQDVVEAFVTFPGAAPKAVKVIGPDGKAVPAQLEPTDGDSVKVLFVATVPSVGFAVYDVQPAAAPARQAASPLRVTRSSLENARYRVRLNSAGDVSSIYDKATKHELLSAPARLAFQQEKPSQWPAWNMDWSDQQKPPRGYVDGPATITITENGPVRVGLTVDRKVDSSRFVQTIRLSAGDAGNRVEFGNVIDWKMGETALKATFPLTASNTEATYNWQVGTIKRPADMEKKFEFPSHQWFDLTDQGGAYGVTVLSDDKNGSDRPDDHTLRLTLLYSPGISPGGRGYSDQATQDWGHHEFIYGLAGHKGDWRTEQSDWQALRLNQPLIAFASAKHPGALGKTLSLLTVSDSRVRVMALKRAEDSDELIVRMVEEDGKPQQNVRLTFAAPVVSAREVNGQEMEIGKGTVTDGSLVTSLTPYQLRSFAVTLAAAPAKVAPPTSQPMSLPYDRAVTSEDSTKSVGGFDTEGNAIPAEMLPSTIDYSGVRFTLAPSKTGTNNAVVPSGQTIPLPAGHFTRLYLLAASADADRPAVFSVGSRSVLLTIQNWGGFIGQWDNRQWKRELAPPPTPEELARFQARQAARDSARRAAGDTTTVTPRPFRRRMIDVYDGLTPGFIKRAPVAWYASHHHTADGANEPYAYSYLFAYTIDVPEGATTLTLPDAGEIRILAVTAVDEPAVVKPAQPLYDTLQRTRR